MPRIRIAAEKRRGADRCRIMINSREAGGKIENDRCRTTQPNEWLGWEQHYKSYRREKQFTN